MDFLATPDTVTGTAGSATPGAPTRVGLLTDGTSPNDASKNWAKYYNMLLEEMRHIIVTFGGTPDDDNWHQAADNLKARLTFNGIDADLGDTNKFFGDVDTLLATGKYYVDPTATNQAFGGAGEIITVDREDDLVVYQTSQCVNGQGKATRCLFNRMPTPTGWTDWDYSVTASTATKAAAFVAEVEGAYPRLIAAGNFSSDAAGVILSSNQTAGWTLAKHPSDAGSFIVSHASIAIDDTKHSLAATTFGSSAEGFGSWGTTSFDSGDMVIDSQFTAGTPTWQVSGSWQIFQFAA